MIRPLDQLGESLSSLPLPDADALAHSRRLCDHICTIIDAAGGSIDFSRYMDLVLYAPGLGYYSAGARKFGAGGDFITAPEISPLFGRCLARQCQQVLSTLGGGDILELGAGSGKLAADLLTELASLDCLPDRYLILEVSADLRERQQQHLQQSAPQFLSRVQWLDELPAEPIEGVMLGNEVLDALPVRRLLFDKAGMSELAVTIKDDAFTWQVREADIALQAIAVPLLSEYADRFILPYCTEINLDLMAWMQGLAESLQRGMLLLIDYGYPRAEYYHPQRTSGTLICHYRQRAHDDPFMYPGLQDISASVDFTLVAEAADQAGLQVAGYTSQAQFLLGCGLDELLAEVNQDDSRAYLSLSRQAKQLTLPAEMGERFKAIALTRDVDQPLRGFIQRDQRHRL